MGRSEGGGWLMHATRTIAVEVAPSRARSESSATSARQEWFCFAAACVIGAGIALSGFPPLNNLSAVLHVDHTPALVLLTPPMLLAACALLASRLAPARHPASIPPLAIAAVAGLVVGGGLSLLQSPSPETSLGTVLDDIVAPALVFFGLRRSRLPLDVIAGACLAALTCALLRADVVFFAKYGFPTQSVLFNVKFADSPYDFHYYTLGNPDKTAAFLLMPLALSLFWAMSSNIRRRSRALLLASAAVFALTLVLTYSRFVLLVAIAIVIAAILIARWSWRQRIVALTPVVALVVLAASSKGGSYLTDIFSTTASSSGGERIHSLSLAFHTISHHPWTGVGVGQYGLTFGGSLDAHSSLIEAGAEMGVFGLVGLLLLIVAFSLLFRTTLRRHSARSFAGGAAIAGFVYQVTLLLTGNVDVGLIAGYVGIYGLTLALVAAIALRGEAAPARVPAALELSFKRTVGSARSVYGLAAARWAAMTEAIGWRGLLVAYGIVVSGVTTALLASRIPAVTLLASRQREVHDALTVIRSGGPPLLGMTAGHYYPIDGAGHGTALYLPLLGQIFHQSNPNLLMAWLFLGAFAVTLATYPLVFGELFGSRLIAFAAPLLLAWRFAFIHYADTYWVYAWALATALPVLLLVHRRWGGRRATVLLVGTTVFASFSNSLRAYSGLPILLSALVVWALGHGSVRRRLLILAACIGAYFSVAPGVFTLIGAARDQVTHSSATYRGKLIASPGGSGDAFWQAAYTGLAFRANHYGISHFDNSVAITYVRKVKPDARYRSPEYNAALRSRFVSLLGSHFGSVVATEAEKGLLVLDDGLNFNWTLILLLPILLAGPWRRRFRRDLVIVVPAAAVAFLGATLSWPAHTRFAGYEFGWLGSVDFLWILMMVRALAAAREIPLRRALHPRAGSAYSVAAVVASARAVLSDRRAAINAHPRPFLVGAASLNVGLLLVIAIGVASGPARSERLYQAEATYRGSIPPPSLPLFESWSFVRGIPAGFTFEHAAGLPTKRGLEVTTSSAPNTRALVSTRLDLQPGRYELVVRGRIPVGGLALEALPGHRSEPIRKALYWNRQTSGGPTSMMLRFDLSAPAVERLAVANWSGGGSSRWLLQRIELRWMPPRSVKRWGFSSGVPAGWTVEPGTNVARQGGGVTVTTSRTAATYQLINPTVALKPGTYELSVAGRISSGGMDVGVVDVPTNKWIQQTTLSAGPAGRTIPTISFTLSSPTIVQVAFANFAYPAGVSTWLITHVDLRKLTAQNATTGQTP